MPYFRPRLNFSLRTFALITLACIPVWWAGTYIAARRAGADYRNAQALWEAEALTTLELCQKSSELLHAQLRVPLADRRAAHVGHLERITHIWEVGNATRQLSWMSDRSLLQLDLIKQMQLEAQRAVDESK